MICSNFDLSDLIIDDFLLNGVIQKRIIYFFTILNTLFIFVNYDLSSTWPSPVIELEKLLCLCWDETLSIFSISVESSWRFEAMDFRLDSLVLLRVVVELLFQEDLDGPHLKVRVEFDLITFICRFKRSCWIYNWST